MWWLPLGPRMLILDLWSTRTLHRLWSSVLIVAHIGSRSCWCIWIGEISSSLDLGASHHWICTALILLELGLNLPGWTGVRGNQLTICQTCLLYFHPSLCLRSCRLDCSGLWECLIWLYWFVHQEILAVYYTLTLTENHLECSQPKSRSNHH